MITAVVKDFDSWRLKSREFLAAKVSPELIQWQNTEEDQSDLFSAPKSLCAPERGPLSSAPSDATPFNISPALLTLLNLVACHRDNRRWPLLYQCMWRYSTGEKHLLDIATDPLIHKLREMESEVRRDAHKTKAFVRFRCIKVGGIERYVAWHRPDHRVLSLVAPFFARRFSQMQWSILTPDESITWDGEILKRGPGVANGEDLEDASEDLWLVYYASTFNPARVKVNMMKREMPVRHWPTLPETRLIPKLLAEAPSRVEKMLSLSEGSKVSAASFLPVTKNFASLKEAAKHCQGCSLHCDATQTVFGEGSLTARLMLVGEQPGDQEDLGGRPFVGPAGHILDEILRSLNLSRRTIYVTNAVKHFKFVQNGQQRLHKAPDAREINACKPWLINEVEVVNPSVIVTLGVSAARSLIHQGFSLKHDSMKSHFFKGKIIRPTWHPSAYLRASDEGLKREIWDHIGRTINEAHTLSLV